MDKKFLVGLLQDVVRATIMSMVGTATVALTRHAVNVILKEDLKRQSKSIGFMSLIDKDFLKGEKIIE